MMNMLAVNKADFFAALEDANQKGLDPMPQRKTDDWVCQKTHKIFGRSVHVGCPNKWNYYVNEART